jgi:hypothetical protein
MCALANPVQTPAIRAWLLLRRWVKGGSLAFIVACAVTLSAGFASAGAQSAAPKATGAKAPGDHEKPAEQGSPTGSRTGSPAVIDGFRDAHFGMNEGQVRRAIRRDFPGSDAKLKKMTHPTEKTTVLLLPVSNLLPDTGAAQVSYILGYRSKKLIQINVVWRGEGSRESDEIVVGAANSLRDYLAGRSYKPGSEIANRQLAKDVIIVFRGTDAHDRTVLVVLNRGTAAQRKGKKAPPLMLELSYIADAAHPDVFHIGKGQF